MEGKTQGRRRRERLGRSPSAGKESESQREGGWVSVNKRCSLPPPPQAQMESRLGKGSLQMPWEPGCGGSTRAPRLGVQGCQGAWASPSRKLGAQEGVRAALGSPGTRVWNGGWREAESSGVLSSGPQELGCAPLSSSLGSGSYQPSGLWHIGVTEGTGGGDLAANRS